MEPSRRPRRAPPPFVLALVVLVVLVAGGVLVRSVSSVDGGQTTAPPSAPAPAATSGRDAPTPSPRASPKPASRGKLVIHGTGDVNVDPSYIRSYAAHGYGYAWSGLDGLFEDDDLTVINLECAVSHLGRPEPKEFNFRGDPAALPAMRKAGVEVANLGNNHSYDFGPEALVDTRRNLVDARIAPVGAGKDAAEALSPATFDLKGWRIAVVGLDEVVDPFPEAVAGPDKPGTAAGHDFRAMIDAVKAADRLADLVIVIIHWGVELDTQPRAYQVSEGHKLVDAGADVIFGGHSHRLQPLDVYRRKPIFWSLGNFVWPNFSVEGSRTGVAEVRVDPDGDIRARILPAVIEAPGHPVLQRG
jgi:poly-gamma-glutamate synthesis protein (capsule biosynthesis protein)